MKYRTLFIIMMQLILIILIQLFKNGWSLFCQFLQAVENHFIKQSEDLEADRLGDDEHVLIDIDECIETFKSYCIRLKKKAISLYHDFNVMFNEGVKILLDFLSYGDFYPVLFFILATICILAALIIFFLTIMKKLFH